MPIGVDTTSGNPLDAAGVVPAEIGLATAREGVSVLVVHGSEAQLRAIVAYCRLLSEEHNRAIGYGPARSWMWVA